MDWQSVISRGYTCYSGFDPIEDTESEIPNHDTILFDKLQWVRSDRGY